MNSMLIVAFCILVLVLVFIDVGRQRGWVIGIALIALGLGSYLTAQRTIHPLDDVVNYHGIFIAIALGDWTWYETIGGGLEFGLPAIFHLLNLVFGDLSLTGFLFWLTFIGTASALAAYAWLTPKVAGPEHFALKIAFLLTFVSFFGASHTTRQFLGGVALLPMLVLPATRWGTAVWTAVAAVFHTTSLLFASIIFMCRSKWGMLLLALAGLWLIVSLDSFLGFWRYLLPAVLQNKFTILTLQEDAARDISNIPDLVRLGLLCAVVAIGNKIWPDCVPVWARRFTYLGFATFALVINVPFVGNRLVHMLLNVAFGIIVMMSLQRSVPAMRVVVILALAYQARLLTLY